MHEINSSSYSGDTCNKNNKSKKIEGRIFPGSKSIALSPLVHPEPTST